MNNVLQDRLKEPRFSVSISLEDTILIFFMNELLLRRREIQWEIDDYRATPGYNDDERARLLLETAILNLEIIDIKIALINTTKRRKEQIKTKEQQIKINKQLLLLFLPAQDSQHVQVAQTGNIFPHIFPITWPF